MVSSKSCLALLTVTTDVSYQQITNQQMSSPCARIDFVRYVLRLMHGIWVNLSGNHVLFVFEEGN